VFLVVWLLYKDRDVGNALKRGKELAQRLGVETGVVNRIERVRF